MGDVDNVGGEITWTTALALQFRMLNRIAIGGDATSESATTHSIKRKWDLGDDRHGVHRLRLRLQQTKITVWHHDRAGKDTVIRPVG